MFVISGSVLQCSPFLDGRVNLHAKSFAGTALKKIAMIFEAFSRTHRRFRFGLRQSSWIHSNSRVGDKRNLNHSGQRREPLTQLRSYLIRVA